jgi:hypothetical protein
VLRRTCDDYFGRRHASAPAHDAPATEHHRVHDELNQCSERRQETGNARLSDPTLAPLTPHLEHREQQRRRRVHDQRRSTVSLLFFQVRRLC